MNEKAIKETFGHHVLLVFSHSTSLRVQKNTIFQPKTGKKRHQKEREGICGGVGKKKLKNKNGLT